MVAVLFFFSPLCVCFWASYMWCNRTGTLSGPRVQSWAEYCTMTPPLCAFVETPLTKKDYYQELLVWGGIFQSVCSRDGCFSTWRQPVAHANWFQDNAERVTKCQTSHLLQFTRFPRFRTQQIMPTWSVEEILDWCRITLVNTVCIIHKRHKMAHSLKNDQRQHPEWTKSIYTSASILSLL